MELAIALLILVALGFLYYGWLRLRQEAEAKARRLNRESRVLVDLGRMKTFDSTVLSALLEIARHAGKPLAVHNPPQKLVSLAQLYGVADFLLDDHPELRKLREALAAEEEAMRWRKAALLARA